MKHIIDNKHTVVSFCVDSKELSEVREEINTWMKQNGVEQTGYEEIIPLNELMESLGLEFTEDSSFGKPDYNTDRTLFSELCQERKTGKQFGHELSSEHLKKAWFSIVESTGGGAESNPHSEHAEERVLALIENALLEINSQSKC